MKVGILSDTHDDREAVIRAVELFNKREVHMAVHAGEAPELLPSDIGPAEQLMP